MTPPADRVIVERLGNDLFRIEWWGRDGRHVLELSRAKHLTDRINTLTYREDMPGMGLNDPIPLSHKELYAIGTGKEHAP